MDRRELIYEMKKDVKGASFISVNALAKHLGKSHEFAEKVVEGLDQVGKKFFIPDVATRLMDMRGVKQ